jgi:hypothetical protein
MEQKSTSEAYPTLQPTHIGGAHLIVSNLQPSYLVISYVAQTTCTKGTWVLFGYFS